MADRTAVNITLPPELSSYIKAQVESGNYESATDVICQGLRLLELREAQREELRKQIEIGFQQIERGEVYPGEQVFEEIRQLSAARRAQTK